MSLRRIHRADLNQAEIVQTMRDVGAEVFVTGQPFDLMVAYQGRLMLADCKNPETGHDWTTAQLKSIARLNRQGVGVWRLENSEDALRMLRLKSVVGSVVDPAR